VRAVVAGLVFLAAAASPLAAQERRGIVEIDHRSGHARFIYIDGTRADTSDVGVNPTVRVPRGVAVLVRVVGTNTALYRFGARAEVQPAPDLDAVRSLVLRSAPFMPELRTVAAAIGGRGGEDAAEAEAALAESDRRLLVESTGGVRAALGRVDRAVHGRAGLQEYLTSTLYALERMRLGERPELAAEDLRAMMPQPVACGDDAPVRLNTAQELLAGVFAAARAQSELSDAIGGPAYWGQSAWRAAYDTALVVEARAHEALADFEGLVGTAYRLERLAGIVAGACSTREVGRATPGLTSGSSITVTATPRGESELLRVAEFGSATWTVTVQRRVMLGTALSIGAAASPQAMFPIYGTSAVAGGGFEVVETGSIDARFGAAGVLGFTYGVLDRRDKNGTAIWFPEIAVTAVRNPGFGVGAGYSWQSVRVGVGGMWTRRRVLNGTSVGVVLADPSELRTTDSYARPELYFSLSIFDWSPLAARLR
jgi:hypothetical protein